MARIPNITRQVYPGETVALEAIDEYGVGVGSAVRWSVYLRTEPTAYSSRLGSWDITTEAYVRNAALTGTLLMLAGQITGAVTGPDFTDAVLESMREASAGRRDVQTIWYDEDGRAVLVVTLDFGDLERTTLDGLIFRDEEYLGFLQDARDAAARTNGIASLILPDGRQEVYRSVETLDRMIDTVADRLARDKAARGGSYVLGWRVR